MKQKLHTIFMIAVLGVFLVSGVRLVMIWAGYLKSKNIRQEAVEQFIRVYSGYKPKEEASALRLLFGICQDGPAWETGSRGQRRRHPDRVYL